MLINLRVLAEIKTKQVTAIRSFCVDLFLSDLISSSLDRGLLTECFNSAGLLGRAESAIASPDVAVAAGAIGRIELCLCW